MSRLPTVSGDGNAWGTILNDFLSVSHSSNGTLKNLPINLKDTCAIDGVTDDSVPFTAAYAAAAAAGVGLFMPGGTLIKGNDTLLAGVTIDLGGGTIKLKNGANTDLFSAQTGSINLAAAPNSGAAGTLHSFTIKNGVLDGNKANQTAGTSYPLRFYGYDYKLENLYIRNGYSGGVLIDWNGGGSVSPDSMEATWTNVKVHDNNGIGVQMGGPHDTQWSNVLIFNSGTINLHLAPNCVGMQIENSHVWGAGSGNPSVVAEASTTAFTGCSIEGSNVVQVVLLGVNSVVSGGRIFGLAANPASGVQIGQQSGQTPYAGQIYQSAGVTTTQAPHGISINTIFDDCVGTNGAIWAAADGGGNTIIATVNQTSGTALSSSYNSGSLYLIRVNGLTADGTQQKGGMYIFPVGAYSGFTVNDANGSDIFNINTLGKSFQMVNGTDVIVYSGNYSGQVLSLNADGHGSLVSSGNLAIGQSATTPDPGAGGTITTANIGLARVTPAASRTGVIMQAGTVAGQKCTVVNNSASFTITFAAAATSNVAQGVSLVIAALGKYDFTWDSVAARWY